MAHPDLEELLNTLLPFAREMLCDHGEFYPFAAWTRTDGQVVHVGADCGVEIPRSHAVLDVLNDAILKQVMNGAIRAAGVCLDMRVVPPGKVEKCDAVCVRLAHESGESVDVYLPYELDETGALIEGKMYAGRGTMSAFSVAGTA